MLNIFQSHPNSEFTIHYAKDSHLVVGMQINLDQVKFDRNLCQYAPNVPKSHLEVSNDQNVQTPHIGGIKNAHFGAQQYQTFAIFFAPNDPK